MFNFVLLVAAVMAIGAQAVPMPQFQQYGFGNNPFMFPMPQIPSFGQFGNGGTFATSGAGGGAFASAGGAPGGFMGMGPFPGFNHFGIQNGVGVATGTGGGGFVSTFGGSPGNFETFQITSQSGGDGKIKTHIYKNENGKEIEKTIVSEGDNVITSGGGGASFISSVGGGRASDFKTVLMTSKTGGDGKMKTHMYINDNGKETEKEFIK